MNIDRFGNGFLLNINKGKPGLCLFKNENKPRTVHNDPSVQAFATEFNNILEVTKPKLLMWQPGMSVEARLECSKHNQKELVRSVESRYLKLFTNEVIKAYLLRKSVLFNQYGVPEYHEFERKILYEYEKVPYICCRNPDRRRSPDELVFQSETALSTVAYRALNFALNPDKKPKDVILNPMLAFNFLGIPGRDNPVLIKNKKRFDEHKEANFPKFKGIHFMDYMDIREMINLLTKIQSQEIKLDDSEKNVFICPMFYKGHATCCLLVVDGSKDLSETVVELVLFDSEKNDSTVYLNGFIASINGATKDHFNLKFIYVPYGAQVRNGVHNYDYDGDCVFYAIHTMNVLVNLLVSSEGSALRKRFLGDGVIDQFDNEEDIAVYIQEIRKEQPDYFHLDEASGLYCVNSFEERQFINIAKRWLLGRLFLKQFFAGFQGLTS